MPFKPNYRMQRADRERAKEEKLKRKLERRAADKGEAPNDETEHAPVDVDANETAP